MNKILCVIDIQKEYLEKERPFFIEDINSSLTNAKKLLEFARENKWKIVHIQHLQNGNIFTKENHFSDFITGFDPKDNEIHFTKDNFSSFSNQDFTHFLGRNIDAEIYIIGYGSTMCCLSTIIDGYHRGFKFSFVTDASSAKPTEYFTSKSIHKAACDIIKTFAQLKLTHSILEQSM